MKQTLAEWASTLTDSNPFEWLWEWMGGSAQQGLANRHRRAAAVPALVSAHCLIWAEAVCKAGRVAVSMSGAA